MKTKIFTKGAILSLFLVLFLTGLHAATFTGAGDGITWEDGANWDTGIVPDQAENVIIDGTSIVTISTTAYARRIRLRDDAILIINFSSNLILSSFGNNANDRIRMIDNAILVVNGSLNILASNRNGFDLDNRSLVVNNGMINISSCNSAAIQMNNDSDLVNNGSLRIEGGNSDGIDLENNSQVNNNGDITILDSDNEGIDMDNSSDFFNYGTVLVEGAMGDDGVCLDDNNVYFENHGTLTIKDVAGTGEGLEVDDGELMNTATGVINIMGVAGDALMIESGGLVRNEGTIHVNATSNGSNNAVEVRSSGRIINSNLLNISNTGSGDGLELESNSSIVDNEACGVINIVSDSKIDVQGTGNINNDGVIATNFTGVNTNNGTITNNGAINAPSGFAAAPNAVVGGGAIAAGPVPAQSSCNIAIGGIGCTGSTTVDQVTGTYTQTSDMCLYQVPYLSDKISYAFQQLCGDGEIYAKVASVTTLGWGGVTMRESTNPGSKKVQLMANQSEVLRREIRTATNGPAYPANIPFYGHNWLRLVRSGDYVAGYVSQNGVNWMFFFNQYIPMADCIEVGVVSTNYNINTSATIVFENVTIIPGVAPIMEEDEVMDTENATELTKEEELGDYSLPAIEGENAIQASIFPNPTTGQVTVELDPTTDEMVDLRIFNTVGQLMQSHRFDPSYGSLQQVDLTGMPAGMYYFHLLGQNGSKRVERVVLK